MDEFRKKLGLLKTESQNIILVSTGVMQRYQLQLEKLKNNVKTEEKDKLQRENKAKHVSRDGSQSMQAIKNLFNRCASTMRVKPVYPGNRETASASIILDFELDAIKTRISDLLEISKDYKYSLEHAPIPLAPDLREASTTSMLTGPTGVGSKSLNSK